MTLTIKATALKIKSAEGSTGIIEGYASTFNNIDTYGDTITPGAFTETLAKHAEDDSPVPLLFEHSRSLDSHVGQIIDAREDDTGLFIKAQFDMETDSGQKAFNLAKSRRIQGMSIGFMPLDVALEVLDGEDVFAIKKIDLREISLVLNPADAQAQVTSVKSADVPEDAARRAALVEKAESLDMPNMSRKSQGKTGTPTLNERLAERISEVKSMAARSEDLAGLSDKLAEIDEIRERIADGDRKAANLRELGQLEYDDDTDDTNPRSKENSHMKQRVATKAAERSTVARKLAAELSTKSVAGADILVPVQASTAIVPLERAPLVLLSAIPTSVVDSPSFSYLRQNSRVLNADVVATGEKKPTSTLGFERIDDSLDVVAHLVPNIDEYILQDSQGLESFIANEMVAGVLESVEGQLINATNSVEGSQVQEYTDDVFTTTRHAKTKLHALGLEPAYYVMSHDDWGMMETARETGSGAFVFNSAPVDQTNGTLWGVTVLPTSHVESGQAKLLSVDSVGLWTDAGVKVQTNRSAADFENNEVTFRAEGRFKPAVLRAAGIVGIELAAPDAA